MRTVLFFAAATAAIAGQFSTSVGDTYPFQVSAITTDSIGNTYVVGSRVLNSTLFLLGTAGAIAFGLPSAAPGDVFVTKLDPAGKALFTDVFSGKGVDTGSAIALDPSGNIYIAGSTTSDDFPLSNAIQTQPGDYGSGFIVKLTNDGGTILYSTYFGGTLGGTSITALATDKQGNLYLTGTTTSSDFPHTDGMPFGLVEQGMWQTSGAIIASLSPGGDKIRYAGFIAGVSPICDFCFLTSASGASIAVDASGNAYIAGNTNTFDLPTTPGVISSAGVGALIAKVNSGGTGLSYLSYIDNGQYTGGYAYYPANTLSAIAVDPAGNAYLAGSTCDPAFPATAGSFQPAYAAGDGSQYCQTNGFLAKLKPDASAFLWATYFGGTNTSVESIAIDTFGNVWATGSANAPSAALPNTNGWSTGPDFLASLSATGSELSYSALYRMGTVGQAVALDPAGYVHVGGANGFVSEVSPYSGPPMTIFAFQSIAGGNWTARISPAEVISIFGPGIGPATALTATPSGGFYPKTLAGVQVSIDGAVMPLLYVSENRIDAVVPMDATTNAAAMIRVTNGARTTPAFPVWIQSSTPQPFPSVMNQDGTINSEENPAKSGSVVTFYATGWQSNFAPLTDGEVATAAADICHSHCQLTYPSGYDLVSASTVLYAGAAPGIVAGITQFDVRLGTAQSSIPILPISFSLTDPSGSSTILEMIWIEP